MAAGMLPGKLKLDDRSPFPFPCSEFHGHHHLLLFNPIAASIISAAANARGNQVQLSSMKFSRKKTKPRLITISTSDGKWHDNWNYNYTFPLQQLLQQPDVLDDDANKDAEVSISLFIQKHSGLGMSVQGQVKTCFTRKCCNCCTPYLGQIDVPFKVWILPSRSSCRKYDDFDDRQPLPEIDADDPSVIYVNPGCEADLDSLIQATIQLAAAVRETCSEVCENSEPKMHHLGRQNTASIDKRWNKLLELKNSIS